MNCSLKLTKEVQHYKKNINSQIIVRSQTDVATDVTVKGIVERAKGNDDREVIITKELKSHLCHYQRTEESPQGTPIKRRQNEIGKDPLLGPENNKDFSNGDREILLYRDGDWSLRERVTN